MKKLQSRLVALLLFSFLFITISERVYAQDVSVSYQTFYDELSPYGQWVNDPQYGNVWVPNEGGDFRPYGSNGHWVMTDYGNTWVSDDPWGWACYHYGRWTYDSYYGWVWVPGYEWAPAWVSWRFGGGYSGWAPLGPGVSVGVSYNCPDSWWVFVAPQYMYEGDCFRHWRGPGYNGDYIRHTSFVNNSYVDNRTQVHYNFGPRADAIQGVTHQPVQVYRLSEANRAGAPRISGNSVNIYRPAVNRGTANTARPANVIAAPQRIGGPKPATNVAANHQPAFRQELQKQAPGNATTHTQGNINNQHAATPPPTQTRPQQQNRPQSPQPQGRPTQPQNQPQPQTRQPQPPRQQAPPPQTRQPQPPRQQAPPPQTRQPQPPRQQAPPPQMRAPQPPPRQAPPPQQRAPQPPPRQAPPQQRAPQPPPHQAPAPQEHERR